MKSLWIRLELVDQANGCLLLWEKPFPGAADDAVLRVAFPLAPLDTQAARDALDRVKSFTGADPGQFDDVAQVLRTLLPAPALAEWLRRQDNDTRTFLEIADVVPPGGPAPPARRLADLPWEYLANTQAGIPERLFLNPLKPVVRVHRRPGVARCEVEQLKVVVISGERIDWRTDAFPGDDAAAVLREFQASERCSYVRLLEAPTLPELEKAFEIEPEIIHFSGHGERHPDTGRPALRIDATAGPWFWDTGGIASYLSRVKWRPRLVVLNACESARNSGLFCSVLDAFTGQDVASVVGAQASPRQDVLQHFSRALYRDLLDDKAIDVAVARARAAVGEIDNNAGWLRRDWGLPILSLAISPDDLWPRPARPPALSDPAKVVAECAELREFLRADGHTAPFVGLGWPEERWKCLDAIRSRPCTVIKGASQAGKSWLVKRTLRDAVHLGHRVRYVDVCSDNAKANFIDLLAAIIEGDRTPRASELRKPLDAGCFTEFDALRQKLAPAEIDNLPLSAIEQICSAFARGLQQVAKSQTLTLVLDQFARDHPRLSFSPDEFKTKLLPYLWLPIARGTMDGVRLILVVRHDQYGEYGLDALPDEPIELPLFEVQRFRQLFYELCRFRRTKRVGGTEKSLDRLAEFYEDVLPSPWGGGQFQEIRRFVEKIRVP